MFVNSTPVTDGKLAISIRLDHPACVSRGTAIFIRLIYHNLTHANLTIADSEFLAEGSVMGTRGLLHPYLETLASEKVTSEAELASGDIINPRSPQLQTIGPQGTYEVVVRYNLPSKVAIIDETRVTGWVPLPSGRYWLRLVYIAIELHGAWDGVISSNRIEICVSI